MATRTTCRSVIPIDPRRRLLTTIREGLLGLHGALIVTEQKTYEHLNGPVDQVETLLDLLQHDPWFTWLHPISDLVVRIDYVLDDDAFEITEEIVVHLLAEIAGLLHPSVEGEGFDRAYYEALQRDPEVVLAHVRVRRMLPEAA